MKCKDCKYNSEIDHACCGYKIDYCEVINVYDMKECNYSDSEIDKMDICFNCIYWIGGGDWGLSCMKNYYIASTNGFRKVGDCEQFTRKER